MTAWLRHERISGCDLYLGDALETFGHLSFDSLVTDPPYGMAFQSNYREKRHRAILNDDSLRLLQWACEIKANHSSYVWMRWDNLREVPRPKSLITWVKDNWSMGDLDHEHGRQTEVCAFYPGPNHIWPKGRPSDVIKCPRTGNEHHPTQKPVQLMSAVVGWTMGVVLDPFMGSGSTLVACANLGRSGIGIELDPEYFDIACRRVDAASRQPDLFVGGLPAALQESLL